MEVSKFLAKTLFMRGTTQHIFVLRGVPFQDVAKAGLKFGDEGMSSFATTILGDNY